MRKFKVLLMTVIVAGIVAAAFSGCTGKELPVTLNDIKDAQKELKEVAVLSDLKKAETLSGNEQSVYLKLENTQPINSFKLRGAFYMMNKLSPEELSKGVCTCSAGNHAQGVGLAADRLGCKATIYVPFTAPKTKINKIKTYKNVKLKIVDGNFEDTAEACLEDVKKTGKIYIPPYDNEDVIAGQGTVGLEIMDQLPDADAVVVPIGGGGLASGIAIAVKSINPDCKVYAVEPETAASMKKSVDAGKPVKLKSTETIADGTAVSKPGDITYKICSTLCDGFITVTEKEIEDAIAHLYMKEGVTAEGAGALSTAAVMTGQIPSDCKKVVCVVSGGNIDPDKLQKIVKKAKGTAD